MNCELATEYISRLLDEDLSPEESDELYVHLRGCPDCCAVLAALSSVSALSREADEEPPADLCANVMRGIQRSRREKKIFPLPKALQVTLPAAACFVILAIGAATLLPGRSRSESAATSAVYMESAAAAEPVEAPAAAAPAADMLIEEAVWEAAEEETAPQPDTAPAEPVPGAPEVPAEAAEVPVIEVPEFAAPDSATGSREAAEAPAEEDMETPVLTNAAAAEGASANAFEADEVPTLPEDLREEPAVEAEPAAEEPEEAGVTAAVYRDEEYLGTLTLVPSLLFGPDTGAEDVREETPVEFDPEPAYYRLDFEGESRCVAALEDGLWWRALRGTGWLPSPMAAEDFLALLP